MLNARKHVKDNDLEGDVSSGYGVIKLQKIYERLVGFEASSGYVAHKIAAGSWHKAQCDKQMHENAITT